MLWTEGESVVKGLGTDLLEVERFRGVLERGGSKLLDRLFSAEEQAYCQSHRDPVIHFAGRFTAKEAIVKAHGTGIREGVGWLDICVLNDSMGKPYVVLHGQLLELLQGCQILLSISHTKSYATATAIIVSCRR